MQFWFGRLTWRAVVVFLLFVLGSQSVVRITGIPTSSTGSADSAEPKPALQSEQNSEQPLEGPATSLAAPDGGSTANLANDPHLERGDIRPPAPEPAGTIVDGQTNRHTRTVSKGDGSYTRTTATDSINY